MNAKKQKLALGAVLAFSLTGMSAHAKDGSVFEAKSLKGGYIVAENTDKKDGEGKYCEKCKEGKQCEKCKESKDCEKCKEGKQCEKCEKCKEGKCGGKEGKCGEGACGGKKS